MEPSSYNTTCMAETGEACCPQCGKPAEKRIARVEPSTPRCSAARSLCGGGASFQPAARKIRFIGSRPSSDSAYRAQPRGPLLGLPARLGRALFSCRSLPKNPAVFHNHLLFGFTFV